MTDQRLRAAERAAATGDLDARAALARARLRAGESVSLAVPKGAKHGDHVVTWGSAPPSVVVPLRALVGCEVADLLASTPASRAYGYRPESLLTEDWIEAIARLAVDLPPVRVDNAIVGVWDAQSQMTFRGVGTHETPGDRYLLACVAIAAAREALPVWEGRHARQTAHTPSMHQACCEAPRRAIKAAEAWRACPCPEREREWRDATSALPGGFRNRDGRAEFVWVSHPQWTEGREGLPGCSMSPHLRVEDAARLTDVRPAIREAVLSMTGGVW